MSITDITRPGHDPADDTGLVVGRKPIVDGKMVVNGYRLVVAGQPGADSTGGLVTEELTARVDQIHQVFGDQDAFVRPSAGFLVGRHPVPVPAEQAVIEVDGASGVDPAIVDACRELAASGHRIAVNYPSEGEADATLLSMAHYVRLDLGTAAASPFAVNRDTLDGLPERLHQATVRGATPIAVGVDTFGQLKAAKTAGFELFEGRVLSRPMPSLNEALTPSRVACLEMLQRVNDPMTSAADLEDIVETDPGLSYRILHVSGLGASGGLRRPVRSIREATVLLGREWIHRWLVLMVVADANGGTPEQLMIAMTRGRMCERLAESVSPQERGAAFTVGMVSALDLLLGSPIADIVSKLAITDDLKNALLGRAGPLGEILSDTLDWMDWDPSAAVGTLRTGVDPLTIEGCYLDALEWAAGLTETLTQALAA